VAAPLDVTDEQSVSEFAAKVTADLGEVEVLVSNAGSVAPGLTHEISSERFGREMTTSSSTSTSQASPAGMSSPPRSGTALLSRCSSRRTEVP